MKKFLLASIAALMLSGCVSLGLSQADSESTYTVATIAANVYILSGKATPDAIGQFCLLDAANYGVLVSTRNVGDMTNYAPADTAHLTLQLNGARVNPLQCNTLPIVPPPKGN